MRYQSFNLEDKHISNQNQKKKKKEFFQERIDNKIKFHGKFQ